MSPFLYCQEYDIGIKFGVSLSLGNKVKRLGVTTSGYIVSDWAQINSSATLNYNFKSLAINKSTPEIQVSLGAQGGYGVKNHGLNNFIGPTENNSQYKNSIGYTYIRYWDRNGTSQSTGLISLNFNRITIATENDILAGGLGFQDKFRTGGIYLEYQYMDTKIGVNTTLWTGNYWNSPKITDSDYPSKYGYRGMENSEYGNFSASLLSIQVKQLLPYDQVAQVNIGVDDERIRNRIQNKLMHDLKFIPKKWQNTKNIHIPMLTDEGEQYLYKKGQEVKKPTFYYNIGLNNGVFY
ncbi:MAG: polymorphic toxin type 23 domain-containing protein [Flavobacteriales bacterium]